jgi:hypothetical protein
MKYSKKPLIILCNNWAIRPLIYYLKREKIYNRNKIKRRDYIFVEDVLLNNKGASLYLLKPDYYGAHNADRCLKQLSKNPSVKLSEPKSFKHLKVYRLIRIE